MSNKIAYFAGGCFWCITPIFKIYGCQKVVAGYCGNDTVIPNYQIVKEQKTKYRETIAIYYDDAIVDYKQLVKIYLSNVDPYDPDGQFIDKGFSYTLAIFYQDENEKEIARKLISDLEEKTKKQTYISLEPFALFYEAEQYHQDYYLKNPDAFEKELIESKRKKI